MNLQNTTLKRMKALPFDELCDLFGKLYITENSQSKFDQIIFNLNNPNIETYLHGLKASSRTPKFGDIRFILNAVPYFTFAKAETLCVATLCAQTIWNTNFNTNFKILCADDTSLLGIETIIHFHKSKVSITKTIFDKFYETIDGLDQFSSNFLFKIAVSKQEANDYLTAIKEYDNLLSWYPNHEQACFNRGLCKLLLKDYISAFLDFDNTLKLNPRNDKAQNGIGMVLLGQKKYNDARVIFHAILSIYMLSQIKDQVIFNLGLSYVYVDDFSSAISYFNKSLKINPSFQQAYHIRGFCKFKKNQFSEAIRDFNNAIKIDKHDSASYYYRGLSNLAIQKREEACSDFYKAAELGELAASEAIVKHCFYGN